MDLQQLAMREASLNYLIGVFEDEHMWLNSLTIDAGGLPIMANTTRLMALGEALSTKRRGTLHEYFDAWYTAFKEYEGRETPVGVRKVLRWGSRNSGYLNTVTPPFRLDGRIVYVCLCQTILIMLEAISRLSTSKWTPEEQQLYTKLDNKIFQHVIMPGIKTLSNETNSVMEKESKLMRFLRG